MTDSHTSDPTDSTLDEYHADSSGDTDEIELPAPDYTFDEFLQFLSHLEESTSVRILIEPHELLRGRDSHDGFVKHIRPVTADGDRLPADADSDDLDDDVEIVATEYLIETDQLFGTGISDQYERSDVEYRFTVPTTGDRSKHNIEVEVNYRTDMYEEDDWEFAGYLSGGGVLQTFK